MSDSEFDLIHACFRSKARIFYDTTEVGNGDDASVHHIPDGYRLVVSTDSAVAGVHWPHDFPLSDAADRAVCAALSDLAAMGALARWAWVSVMADGRDTLLSMGEGIADALNRHRVELAGGDTVKSPLSALNITVAGVIEEGLAMQRHQAKAGDEVWLVGDLGRSSLGLKQWFSGDKQGAFVPFFQHIQPQLSAGRALIQCGVRCCMDISDGLLQDAGHICSASGVGMRLELSLLPKWQEVVVLVGETETMKAMLSGGEDYALLLTAPPHTEGLESIAKKIGVCQAGSGVTLLLHSVPLQYQAKGYDHFG